MAVGQNAPSVSVGYGHTRADVTGWPRLNDSQTPAVTRLDGRKSTAGLPGGLEAKL